MTPITLLLRGYDTSSHAPLTTPTPQTPRDNRRFKLGINSPTSDDRKSQSYVQTCTSSTPPENIDVPLRRISAPRPHRPICPQWHSALAFYLANVKTYTTVSTRGTRFSGSKWRLLSRLDVFYILYVVSVTCRASPLSSDPTN